jgi:hypothetical protein
MARLLLYMVAFTIVPVRVDGQSLGASMSPCGLCPFNGTRIKMDDHIPLSWTASMTRPAPEMFIDESFLVNGKFFSPDDNNNLTCLEWNTFATTELLQVDDTTNMPACLDLRDYLGGPCCDDPNRVLPPLYTCQATAQGATMLNPSYQKNTAPAFVDAPSSLPVQVQMEVFNAQVLDHGVDGGSISVWGKFTLHWVDERLQFQNISKSMHCYSLPVARSSIWTPRLKGITTTSATTTTTTRDSSTRSNNNNNGNSKNSAAAAAGTNTEQADSSPSSQLVDLPDWAVAIVLADGRVEDSFWGHATMTCQTLPGASKECTMSWHDESGNRNVAYVQRQGKGISNGVIVRNATRMPPMGYKMNSSGTMLRMYSDKTLGPAVQVVDFVVRFDPLELDCNICGDDDGAVLIPNLIPDQPRQWSQIFPNQQDWTCQQLDLFMTNLTVGNGTCTTGRAFFEEACCDDDRSVFECEKSIHAALANQGDTVIPPDVRSILDIMGRRTCECVVSLL